MMRKVLAPSTARRQVKQAHTKAYDIYKYRCDCVTMQTEYSRRCTNSARYDRGKYRVCGTHRRTDVVAAQKWPDNKDPDHDLSLEDGRVYGWVTHWWEEEDKR